MSYWLGPKAAIEAAQELAFEAYAAAAPGATRNGESVVNPTRVWAVPAQTAAGDWGIPGYPGMAVPEGCASVEKVEWSEAREG